MCAETYTRITHVQLQYTGDVMYILVVQECRNRFFGGETRCARVNGSCMLFQCAIGMCVSAPTNIQFSSAPLKIICAM